MLRSFSTFGTPDDKNRLPTRSTQELFSAFDHVTGPSSADGVALLS